MSTRDICPDCGQMYSLHLPEQCPRATNKPPRVWWLMYDGEDMPGFVVSESYQDSFNLEDAVEVIERSYALQLEADLADVTERRDDLIADLRQETEWHQQARKERDAALAKVARLEGALREFLDTFGAVEGSPLKAWIERAREALVT